MSTSIINHVFESHTVRVVSLNGDHWFIAKDVALSLEYKDTKKAIALHCEDDEVNSWGAFYPLRSSVEHTRLSMTQEFTL